MRGPCTLNRSVEILIEERVTPGARASDQRKYEKCVNKMSRSDNYTDLGNCTTGATVLPVSPVFIMWPPRSLLPFRVPAAFWLDLKTRMDQKDMGQATVPGNRLQDARQGDSRI